MARPRHKERRSDLGILKPFDARLMRCYPVSTRINHVANDDEARALDLCNSPRFRTAFSLSGTVKASRRCSNCRNCSKLTIPANGSALSSFREKRTQPQKGTCRPLSNLWCCSGGKV